MTEHPDERDPASLPVAGEPPTADLEARPHPGRRSYGQILIAPPALGALAVGSVFWLASLRPNLLPRPAVLQGGIGAISFCVGYGLGGLVIALACRLGRRAGWAGPSPEIRRVVRVTFAVVGGLAVVAGLAAWLGWQNEQRRLFTMAELSGSALLTVVLVTLVVTAVLLLIGRSVGAFVGWGDRVLTRRLPPIAAHVVVGVLVVVVAVALFNRVVVDAALGGADVAFSAGDRDTEPGVTQPTSPSVSGGPGSLVPWDTLGLQGRTWVAGVSTLQQLHAFAGPGATVASPVRAYAGLASAPTVEERAALAVRDLERAGGFDRKVLVVATATGSGWVNPVASSALEYQWAGDSAMISIQYSYLPSWIAFLTDRSKAGAAGKALNDAVYARWSALPTDHRPQLVVFGESLGSFGSETAYAAGDANASVDAALGRSQGVLWVGPTNANAVWSQVTAARDPGTPVWRPTYGTGTRVAFATAAAELPVVTPDRPRINYLQHSSDPVVWWDLPTMVAPPAWLTAQPRGPDIPATAGWFPFVTWLQTSGDLIEGFSAPAGHGHNYNDAWAQALTSVAAPPGWSLADTTRLAVAMVELHGLEGN